MSSITHSNKFLDNGSVDLKNGSEHITLKSVITTTLKATGLTTLSNITVNNLTLSNDLIAVGITATDIVAVNITGSQITGITSNFGTINADFINISDSVVSDLIPLTDNTYDLGTTSKRWKELFLTGTSINLGGTILSAVDGEFLVDGVAIESSGITGTFGTINADFINISDSVDSDLIPLTDNTYDLGTTSKRWKELFLTGTSINLGGTILSAVDGEFLVDGVAIESSGITGTFGTVNSDYVNVVNDLIVDTNTLFVNSSNNSVGIGKSPISNKLEINGSLSLDTANTYKINNVDVLTNNTLGSNVVSSSLTSSGSPFTINSGGLGELRLSGDKVKITGETSGQFRLFTDGLFGVEERIRIDSNGNITMFNSNPTWNMGAGGFFNVQSTTARLVLTVGAGTDARVYSANGDLTLGAGNTNNLVRISKSSLNFDISLGSLDLVCIGVTALSDGYFGGDGKFTGNLVASNGDFSGNLTVTNDLIVNTDTIFVDSSNNLVGINTNNILSFAGFTDNTVAINLQSGKPRFTIKEAISGNVFSVKVNDDGTNGGDCSLESVNDMTLNAGQSVRMRIEGSGNVGIGKTPTVKLDVNGAITSSTIITGVTGNFDSTNTDYTDIAVDLNVLSDAFFGTEDNGNFIRLPLNDNNPTSPVTGSLFYNPGTKKVRIFDGSVWFNL